MMNGFGLKKEIMVLIERILIHGVIMKVELDWMKLMK